MSMNYTRIVVAGIAGIAAMTIVGVYGAPMLGLAPMNPATMLAGVMGGIAALGWLAHFMVGVVLAFGYVFAAPYLPGPGPVRGAIYSIAPWLIAQLVMMPMMGNPIFSGSVVIAMASLIAHFVFGLVIGAILGVGRSAPAFESARPVM